MGGFSAATNMLFTAPNITRDAPFWRAGGLRMGTAVRVIARRRDELVGFGHSRAILPTMLIDVRSLEIAVPASGDTVQIEEATFGIIVPPLRDSVGLVWTCEASGPM